MATVTAGTEPQAISPAAAKITSRLVTFSASYTTGGEAITAAQCGLVSLFAVLPTITAVAGSVSEVAYNRATGKLQAFTTAGEVANTTNLGSLTCDLLCLGTF